MTQKLLRGTAAGLLYYLGAQVAQIVELAPGQASPVWPSAGIALAFLISYGGRLWPGIFIGALAAYFPLSPEGFAAASVINGFLTALPLAAADTLQALVALILVRKVVGSTDWVRPKEIGLFPMVALFVSLISATAGTAVFFLTGVITPDALLPGWGIRWAGSAIGILMFAPLVMTWIHPHSVWKSRQMALNMMMLIGCFLVGGLFFHGRQLQDKEISADFRSHVNVFTKAVHSKLGEFHTALDSVYGFYRSSQPVERDEFALFRKSDQTAAEMKSLAWIPAIRHADLPRFIEAANADGIYDYQIKEVDALGRMVPATEREVYYPVYFIEPQKGNLSALGIDNSSEPSRLAASVRAASLNDVVMTAPVILGQDRETGYQSVLLVRPVYENNKPIVTIEERRANLHGFVTASVRIHDLIKGAFAPKQAKRIHFTMHDVTEDSPRLLYGSTHLSEPYTLMTEVRNLDIYGRKWKMTFQPTLAYYTGYKKWTLWSMILGSLVFTCLISIFVLFLTGQNAAVSRRVIEKTWELLWAQKQLKTKNSQMEKLVEQLKDRTRSLEQEQKKVNEQAESLARASHMKSDFLATMSHEIRTPMNVILGMTDLLAGTKLAGDQKEYMTRLKRASDTLLELINDILDLSKIEAGKLSIERTVMDLNEITKHLEALFAIKAKQRGLELEFKTDPSLPAKVMGDPKRVRQVLMNLISNAIKFTFQGKVSLELSEVKRNASKEKVWICFKVTDTGVGIADTKKAGIFDPFIQADSSTTREFGGTGLGLAISKKIAQHMKGELTMNSEIGKGSVFSFTAPFSTKMDEMKKPETPDAASSETADLTQRQLEEEDLRLDVLLVDDSEDNRMLIQMYLKQAPVNLDIAVNGEEALVKAFQKHYDLILMDMQMPVMDGFTAVAQIREAERKSERLPVSIVALTANAFKEDKQRCLDAGCNGYLAKPIKKAVLMEAVFSRKAA